MTDNPYSAPGSDVDSDKAANEPKRYPSIWKGVVLGGVADIGGTMVMGIIMGIIFVFMGITTDMTAEDIEQIVEQYQSDLSDFSNPWAYISLLFGLGFSALGGYVCAIFAREEWKKAVLILAGLLTAYGLISGFEYYQLGELIVLTLLAFMATLVGGWVRAGRRYSNS